MPADLPEKDMLRDMFLLRLRFMNELNQHGEEKQNYPLCLSEKKSQRHLRDVALRGVEEVFEALQHLKNWKPHRRTEIQEFDDEKFLEEWIDAFNYFITVLIMAGYDADDVYNMYVKKDKVIHERIKSGY
jgi:hypothetical protein